jgi:hypothetical protein
MRGRLVFCSMKISILPVNRRSGTKSDQEDAKIGVRRCGQTGTVCLRKRVRRDEGAYLNRYVTEEQRSRRPIFIATLRAARLLAGCLAHRSKTTAGILPLRFTLPAKIRSSATTPVTDLVH